MGVLMKAIPQINAFVINIELKVIIGLLLFFLLLTPINEFLLELESGMLSELGRILRLIGEREKAFGRQFKTEKATPKKRR